MRQEGQARKETTMEIPADALGFAVVIATLLGTAFGIKLLVWGKAPLRKLRSGRGDSDTDERLAELEQRVEQIADFMRDQTRQIEDCHERLDFAERMLTAAAEPRVDDPESSARGRS